MVREIELNKNQWRAKQGIFQLNDFLSNLPAIYSEQNLAMISSHIYCLAYEQLNYKMICFFCSFQLQPVWFTSLYIHIISWQLRFNSIHWNKYTCVDGEPSAERASSATDWHPKHLTMVKTMNFNLTIQTTIVIVLWTTFER